jgi:hypothetical protein
MELTIKKTTEETIVINDLPKYFKSSYNHIKLTEECIVGVSKTLIFLTPKDSMHFSVDVMDALKLEECCEEEFNQQLQKTIDKIKSTI